MNSYKSLTCALVTALVCPASGDDSGRIQPYAENPFYWQYRGRPVLLLGGSDDDNLFQWTGEALTSQLDLLVACGGNCIRNTMSSRDPENLFPFGTSGDRYDLDQWNKAYWDRLETLLIETQRRGIIVQIELFDMHDLIEPDRWNASPWNPERNINYTYSNTRLPRTPSPLVYRDGGSFGKPHPFFLSIPAANHDRILLGYQQRFVDRVLEHTLRYDHVLYCISNEIHPEYPAAWGEYWARHMRQLADKAGKRIEVTEMHWAPDMTHPSHRALLAKPEMFTYFEASQISFHSGQPGWDQLEVIRRALRDRPRPINHTKIYGADGGPDWAGSDRDAEERFWRNIIGGSASSRFHRPSSGLGLGPKAQSHIRSMRMLTGAMEIFRCKPHNDLLGQRSDNEAYCIAEPGHQYAVYFPDGGEVTLDITGGTADMEIRWLDIVRSEWGKPTPARGQEPLILAPPGKGHWAALVRRR